ncbi:MAG: hypothetical protein IJI14_20015 [Anaerolineaceae bacterium]|nr:hypothetical protein [Anaerolineaceae bacterium]
MTENDINYFKENLINIIDKRTDIECPENASMDDLVCLISAAEKYASANKPLSENFDWNFMRLRMFLAKKIEKKGMFYIRDKNSHLPAVFMKSKRDVLKVFTNIKTAEILLQRALEFGYNVEIGKGRADEVGEIFYSDGFSSLCVCGRDGFSTAQLTAEDFFGADCGWKEYEYRNPPLIEAFNIFGCASRGDDYSCKDLEIAYGELLRELSAAQLIVPKFPTKNGALEKYRKEHRLSGEEFRALKKGLVNGFIASPAEESGENCLVTFLSDAALNGTQYDNDFLEYKLMPFEEVMQTNPYKYTGLVYQNYLCYFEKQ